MAATLQNIGLSDLQDDSQFIYEPSGIDVRTEAFQGNIKLTSIAVPHATSIQANSFEGCSNLVELSIPGIDYASNSSIFGTDDAKQQLQELTSISIGDGTLDIGQTFSQLPNLQQLKLPLSLKTLKDRAFAGTRLSRLRFDNSCKLQQNCLSGMDYLRSLQFDLSQADDNLGLSSCPILNTIYVTSPIGYSKDLLSTFTYSNASSIKFQGQASAINTLDIGSFYGCQNLAEIDMTNSNLQSIPQSAFYQCRNLTAAYFPITVTSILSDAFGFCNRLNTSQGFDLTSITSLDRLGSFSTMYCYNIRHLLDYVGPSAFMNLAIAQGLSAPKISSLTVNIGKLGEQAFGSLDASLTSMSLSISQSKLPINCFHSSKLREIEVEGEALTAIEDGAFYKCQELSAISLPSGIRQIQTNAFYNCESLTSFEFNNSLTSIGENSFYGTGIEEAIFSNASSLRISYNAFANTEKLEYIQFDQLPNETVSSNYAGWDNVTHISVSTNIGEFGYITSEFDWKNKEDVNELYTKFMHFFFVDSAASDRKNVIFDFKDKRLVYDFINVDYNCIKYSDDARTKVSYILTSENDIDLLLDNGMLPSNVREVQSTAFDQIRSSSLHNSQLTNFNLNYTDIIGKGALSGLSSLLSLTANCVTTVNEGMFKNDISLMNVSLPRIQSVQASAFYNCKAIDLIDFGDPHDSKLTSLGNYSFCNCTGALCAVFPSKLQIIPATALFGCTALSTIVIYDGRTTQQNAFKDCPSTLSIYFVDQSLETVLYKRSISGRPVITLSDKFGSPKEKTQIFTSDNECKYPLMIAKSSTEMYIVQSNSFVVDTTFKLLSVDPKYEKQEDLTISTSQLQGIASISPTAFNSTRYFQRIELNFSFADALAGRIVDGTFANPGTINQVVFATSTCPSQSDWDAFFKNKLNRNDSIRVQFSNGYAIGPSVYRDDDMFLYFVKGGVDTIVGVDDTKAAAAGGIANTIASTHKKIQQDAFIKTHELKQIRNFGSIETIDDYAFRFNSSIKSICLSSTNEMRIGPKAFSDSALSTAVVDIYRANGTDQISGYGLEDTVTLGSISYTDKVKHIAPYAMVDCRSLLTSIQFSGKLQTIGEAAFAEFKDSFPHIMDVNFQECTSLTSISPSAFYNSISTLANGTLSVSDSVQSIGDAAFSYNRYSWTQALSALDEVGASKLVGGSHLSTIGASAFMYNHVRQVEFPLALTSIGDYAFAHPKYRFPIHIKENIKSIGQNAFKDNVILNPNNIAKNIAKVDVDIYALSDIMHVSCNSDYIAENRVGFTDATVVSASSPAADPYKSFAYVLSNQMHFCPQNLSIDILNRALVAVDKSSITAYVPAYLSCINSQAFIDCTALTAVSADESLSIGPSAFYNCISLNRIVSDKSNRLQPYHISGVVNDAVFYNCSSLVDIKLLSSVPSIGASAFYNCRAIDELHDDATITMKNWWSLSSIGNHAFEGCSSLKSFDIPKAISSFGDDVFKDCPSLMNVNIDLNVEDFASLVGYSKVEDAITGKFASINEGTPNYGQTRINFLDVTYMNNGIVKIDTEFQRTYYYTKSIGSEDKPRIGLSALNYDEFLKSHQNYINLSAISKIDQFVLANVSKLRSFNVLSNSDPDNQYPLEEIGDYAFSNCRNLVSINGGMLSCEKIGCYAFNHCERLLGLQMSYRMLSDNCIGQGAFYGTSLNKLEIVDCPLNTSGEATYLAKIVDKVQKAIGYSKTRNQNPLELPEYCLIYLVAEDGEVIGKYDSMFHDIMHASIDINRNALTFIDKTKQSIQPLLLVKPIDGSLPAIAANTFHANVVGRWK